MILAGLGANLEYGGKTPAANLDAAALMLDAHAGVAVEACSPWYRTAPVGEVDQPDYINGVVRLSSSLEPLGLMRFLLEVETRFGRVRGERWGPRTMDLDLLDFDGQTLDIEEQGVTLHLPHPRAHERAFVLRPLLDVAPHWEHPVLARRAADFLAEFGDDQGVTRIDGGNPG
jgi:2-amino-4-hydroxy-6-hydroxymethyldihydropteridine diphosphokinase